MLKNKIRVINFFAMIWFLLFFNVSFAMAFDFSGWDALMKQHVNTVTIDGVVLNAVAYKELKGNPEFNKITEALKKKGHGVNRKRVYRLMREMGIQAIYPKPNLSKPCPEHEKYPYLLRGLEIEYPNHVWATDITYLKISGGFIYLAAIIDLYSRKVLSWKISNTQDTQFCIEILEQAIEKYGRPEIFNSDQGSQFTSKDFTEKLKENKIKISMDGKGRALDNIYIERLWRSLKYEDIYIREYETVKDCTRGVNKYFEFYNSERFHQSLKYKTPDEIYFGYVEYNLKKVS